jgi:hypothetical protein
VRCLTSVRSAIGPRRSLFQMTDVSNCPRLPTAPTVSVFLLQLLKRLAADKEKALITHREIESREAEKLVC